MLCFKIFKQEKNIHIKCKLYYKNNSMCWNLPFTDEQSCPSKSFIFRGNSILGRYYFYVKWESKSSRLSWRELLSNESIIISNILKSRNLRDLRLLFKNHATSAHYQVSRLVDKSMRYHQVAQEDISKLRFTFKDELKERIKVQIGAIIPEL